MDSHLTDSPRKSPNCNRDVKVEYTRKDLLTSMQGKFIRVSFDTMMADFVRHEDDGVPPFSLWDGAFNGGTVDAKEALLQQEFINVVAKLNLMGPDYEAVSSPNLADSSDPSGQKPDAGVYLKSERSKDARTIWARTRMTIEFKRQVGHDPFDDKKWPEEFESIALDREANRGQIIHSATEIFLRQHRCFVFSVIVFGTCARIIRWDRSGALVTERFDYKSEPRKICEFLWRFGRMSAARQGYDPSVVEVKETDPEYEQIQKKVMNVVPKDADKSEKIEEYKQLYFVQSLAPGWLRYKVTVPTVDDEGDEDGVDHTDASEANGAAGNSHATEPASTKRKTRSFLICKPHFFVSGAVGRGTRGYVAIDCETDDFVWLKDAWRVDLPGMEKEGDILKKLNNKNVRNIPTVVCHGDILGQRTVTQDYKQLEDPNTMNPLKAHYHYRLVEYEIGQALEEFRDGYNLVVVVRDCLVGILHRDISAGNILIVTTIEDGEICQHGLLNDWELAKELPNPNTPEDHVSARQPDRTDGQGTWLFLSAASLQNKYKKIILQDDLESFFHVLLYMAIQFFPSNCQNVDQFIRRFFEASRMHQGEYICGAEKLNTMRCGKLETLVGFGQDPLRFHIPNDTVDPSNDPSSPSNGADGLPNNTTPTPSNTPSVPHPINIIFATLLSWFAAYYEQRGLIRSEQMVPNDTSSASRPRIASRKKIPALLSSLPGRKPSATTDVESEKKVIASMSRSNLDEAKLIASKLASNLDSHHEMIDLLETTLNTQVDWSQVDKVDILGMNKGVKRRKEDPELDEDGQANKRTRTSQLAPPSAGPSGIGRSNAAPAAGGSRVANPSVSRGRGTPRVSSRR
ncbi:hypothetical protein B0H21DRAFT_884192 [Amylocystis lapponica]|nr:hypothetical protein B0H21DRAFT_884192 [Amylocystis lapponica]